ncbi:MAG: hypothetical protein Q4C70_10460 [Planctomycetia bacterium]|nr:hypothetical protein [Planctomycetia bacterium]
METTKKDEPIRWRAVDDSHLVWRSWSEDDEECGMGTDGMECALPGDREPLSVVYFLDSDDTHLMNQFGVEIIRALQEKPCSVEELVDALVEKFLPSPDLRAAIPCAMVERFVHQMKISGLVYEAK